MTVEFTVQQAWRIDAVTCTDLNFGDGTFGAGCANQQIIGQGTDANGAQYTVIEFVESHTYPSAAAFTAFFESCCRISTLQNGADGSFRVESNVDLTNGNTGGPVSASPAIRQLQIGNIRTVFFPFADPDGDPITCRLGTDLEAGFPNSVPQIAGNFPTVAAVNNGCEVTWDVTTGVGGAQYPIHVVVTSDHQGTLSEAELDLILELVTPPPPICNGGGVFVANVGVLATFPTNVVDPGGVAGNTTLSAQNVPAGATFAPALGTSQPAPWGSVMSWTPGAGSAGTTQIVVVNYQNAQNLVGTCFLTIQVPQCANFGAPCTVGIGGCERTGTNVCAGPGITVCSVQPGAPSAELCNGVDDDCDTVVDDNPVDVNQPCSSGLPGVCDAGLTVCDEGVLGCDNIIDPNTFTETCDGSDEDCDGDIDDGFGLGMACTNGVGECENDGVLICDGPNATRCDAIPGEPTEEVCGDGLDSDCDTVNDDGCPCTEDDPINCQYCNEFFELCVEPCLLDSDCNGNEVCNPEAGLCVPVCDEDADCPQLCNEATGICVECTNDGECPDGEACNEEGGNCAPECSDVDPCAAGSCVDGVCIGCENNNDCPQGLECQASTGECIEPCQLELDCENNLVCDESTGECTDCTVDNECEGGFCNPDGQVCVECLTDKDCENGLVCDEPTNTCVECTTDKECPEGEVCNENNNTCAPGCDENTPCPEPLVCDEPNEVCVECVTDKDCPEGQVCDEENQVCVECTTDKECPEGQVCNEKTNTCGEGCNEDPDCPEGQVCDEPNEVCVECTTDEECPEGQVCDESNNECVGCTSDSDCAEPTPVCDTELHICINVNTCDDDSDCGNATSGRVCNEDNTCVDGCRGQDGNGCPTTEVCSSVDATIGSCSVATEVEVEGNGIFCSAGAPANDNNGSTGLIVVGLMMAVAGLRRNRK